MSFLKKLFGKTSPEFEPAPDIRWTPKYLGNFVPSDIIIWQFINDAASKFRHHSDYDLRQFFSNLDDKAKKEYVFTNYITLLKKMVPSKIWSLHTILELVVAQVNTDLILDRKPKLSEAQARMVYLKLEYEIDTPEVITMLIDVFQDRVNKLYSD